MSTTDWLMQQERLTIFWADGSGPVTWSNLVGGEPDRTEVQKAIQVKQESGSLGEAQLILMNSPGRTDFIIQSTDILDGLFSVNSSEDPLKEFRRLVDKLISNLTAPVSRFAHAQIVLHQVADRNSGYEAVAKMLKSVTVNSDKMTDLTFQVNWPKNSLIDPSIVINQVTKWAVQLSKKILFTGLQGNINSGTTTQQLSGHAVRLEIDLSTPVQNDGDEKKLITKLPDLLKEFRELSDMIKINGEPVC